jgi:hypothetical protein
MFRDWYKGLVWFGQTGQFNKFAIGKSPLKKIFKRQTKAALDNR